MLPVAPDGGRSAREEMMELQSATPHDTGFAVIPPVAAARFDRMLDRLGIAPTHPLLTARMGELRQRCRSCDSSGICTGWLISDRDGAGGLRGFCPNAEA